MNTEIIKWINWPFCGTNPQHRTARFLAVHVAKTVLPLYKKVYRHDQRITIALQQAELMAEGLGQFNANAWKEAVQASNEALNSQMSLYQTNHVLFNTDDNQLSEEDKLAKQAGQSLAKDYRNAFHAGFVTAVASSDEGNVRAVVAAYNSLFDFDVASIHAESRSTDIKPVIIPFVIENREFSDNFYTDNVKSLAEQIYYDRNEELAPILADALQDAGYENQEVIDHLMKNQAPRGCWIVDKLLCKI